MQGGDSNADRWLHPRPVERERSIPLSRLASADDIEHARGILALHQPRAVVRKMCTGCGEPWPCMDARYGWAITGTMPDGGLPQGRAGQQES
jgi:hypothetical protein